MKLALLFPGQASQQAGMGRDFHDEYAEVRKYFAQADETLGYPLSNLIFNGPEEELTLTANAQPAILTVSCAIWSVLKPFVADGTELIAAGHSLGEYSALVAAGAMEFAEAVRIVHLRGRFMQEAVPPGAGKMAAIFGLEQRAIEETLAGLKLEGEVAELANVNSTDQLVISGSAAGIDQAAQALSAAGAKRVVELKVSAPFHSSLMTPAAEKLKAELHATSFSAAQFPVYANVTAEQYSGGAGAIPQTLYRQVTAPVRWMDTIQNMLKERPDAFIEVGPGKVLRMLNARIAREAPCASVGDIEGFERVLAYLSSEANSPA
jgi:[acyl-carrier-protein] S-malonyltransferase